MKPKKSNGSLTPSGHPPPPQKPTEIPTYHAVVDYYRAVVQPHHGASHLTPSIERMFHHMTDTENLPWLMDVLRQVKGDTKAAADVIVANLPPAGALYHLDKPIPRVFRQHRNIFVEGINFDRNELTKDRLLWWQPVDEIQLLSYLKPLSDYLATFDPEVHNFNFMLYKTSIT